ncbi:aryl hydrocarbon receptor 1b [Megalops cyprinoides]|uniref:aryl hydrocarbon receptor 1b n=1 Tax=Megalops cyprinoides TaxID=118141 RepID=UPI0018647D6C|nr:aryl hydrocarbon receptor 1b [Megalops cyprinoides]
MYAGRKRRKPVQRTVKQPPAEGVKSNPSKRHRDRLNSELDRLASLLPFPEEVTSSLDKLSILRLSVSFLRAKNFFNVALKNHAGKALTANSSNHDNSKAAGLVEGWLPEGELLLQALNGFVLVVTAEGTIFYSSHTIQDFLGFQQTDVMHQSVFELIHTEDQQEFRRNLHWALNPPASVSEPKESPADGEPATNSSLVTYDPDQLPPENSSFLERSFVCRFRCLLDNSSGFLALNLQGRLKFLHGQNRRLDDGGQVPPQLALFAIATPLQPPSILEIRTKNMIFRTKHKLDFTPMACDAKGKIVLGYTEAELRVRGSGYQFIHAADMLYCAENHVRMIKTGESGLTVFRLLTKDNRWKWVQANARLVYKNGKPDYIIATQRPLVEEEGGEHLRKRSMHLPFTFATGEALLYQTSYPIPGFNDTLQGKGKNSKSKKSKSSKDDPDPSSLLGALMRQDESVYVCQPAVEPKLSFHSSLFSEQGDAGFTGPLGNDSWSAPSKSVAEVGPEGSSFDPLLATLDSLSLGGEESCSNSELFSALESLGLNAEDLELLLLDERMIRVEMEPDYIPSLNDLLTNNEILSYIHDSLGGRTEASGGVGDSQAPHPLPSSAPQSQAPPTLSLPCPSPAPGPQATPIPYTTYRPPRQPPIVQLSQQMQQHMSGHLTPGKGDAWSQQVECQHSDPEVLPAENGLQSWEQPLHNGHWVTQHIHTSVGVQEDLGNDHAHHHQQEALFNSEAVEPGLHQHQNQWQQNQLLLQLHSQCHLKQKGGDTVNGVYPSLSQQPAGNPQWQSYSYGHQGSLSSQTELATNGSCFSNGQGVAEGVDVASVTHAQGVSLADYNAGQFTVNGALGNSGVYQGVAASTSSCPVAHQKQQLPCPDGATPSCFSQYATQDSALEHILGLGTSHQLPSLESYGLFTSTLPPDASHSKMENGCILNGTSVSYTGNCFVPNGSTAVPTETTQPCPEVLPSLPDPQTSGFYL